MLSKQQKKVLALFLSPIIILIVGTLLVAFLGNHERSRLEGMTPPNDCMEYVELPAIGVHTFFYCEDNGKVWNKYEEEWVEPGKYQSEVIALHKEQQTIK